MSLTSSPDSSTPHTASPGRIALSGAGLAGFLTLVHATNDSFTSMLSALLPILQLKFGLSETVLALLVATVSFSSSVTQPLFGALSDRLGRRLVGALGIVLSSSLLSLIGVVPSVAILFGLLLIGGLGSAAFHPSATSMARSAVERNKGLVVAIFSSGGTLGLALGPLIIGFFVINDILPYTPWLMLPGMVLGVLMYWLVPPQERSPRDRRPKLFDARLFAGPVGILCLAGILRSLSFVTMTNALPLWLVNVRGLASDDAAVFWSLTAFSLFAGLGGIAAGALASRLGRRMLAVGAMLAAVPALFLIFVIPTASPFFFAAVALSGVLINAPVPLLIVSAQDLAPQAMATASGMLMGFTWGTAGVLYVGIGALQELVGITPAMSLSFLFLLPAAFLAFRVLTRHQAVLTD